MSVLADTIIETHDEMGKMINNLASETTDVVSAWGSALAGGGTIVAASAAIAAAAIGIRTLRAARKDSRDRSRPMVAAQIVRDAHPSSRHAYLVLRNYGPSIAYNVRVTFEPEIEDTGTRSRNSSFVPMLLRRYKDPIPNMVPGVEFRNLWNIPSTEKSVDGDYLNDEPIPDVVTARVRYSDTQNFWDKQATQYVEEFVLDVNILRGDVITTYSDDHLGLHKRTTEALESVSPAITQAAEDIRRIEGYLKPEAVREKEIIEKSERMRKHAELISKVLPNGNGAEGTAE